MFDEKFISIELENIKDFVEKNQTTLILDFGQFIKLRYDNRSESNYRIFVNGVLNIADSLEGELSFFSVSYSEDIEIWCNHSSFLAGEIIVESFNFSCKLAIVLRSEKSVEKSLLTIINPESCDLIVDSGDIIEFVLFEEGIDDKAIVTCDFTPSAELDINFDLIGYADFVINLWSPTIFDFPKNYYATFPRVALEKDSYCSQYHFWFRFSRKMFECAKKKSGICHIGNFSFSYESQVFNLNSYKNCSIYVDFDKIDELKLLNSFLLLDKNEVENQMARSMNKDFFENDNMNQQLHVFDISLSLIESKNLEDGCKTLPSNQKSLESNESRTTHRTGGFSRMLPRKPYFKYFD